MQAPNFHITLKDIRPSQNRQRVYTIAVYAVEQEDSYSIMLFWGRVGATKQRKVQTCSNQSELDKCLVSVLKTRLKHGYVLVEKSKNAPDYEILEEFEKASLYSENQLCLF